LQACKQGDLTYGCQIWEMQKAKKTKVQRLKDRAPCYSLKEDLSEGEGEAVGSGMKGGGIDETLSLTKTSSLRSFRCSVGH